MCWALHRITPLTKSLQHIHKVKNTPVLEGKHVKLKEVNRIHCEDEAS